MVSVTLLKWIFHYLADFYFLLIRNGEDTLDECYQGLGSGQEDHLVDTLTEKGANIKWRKQKLAQTFYRGP